MNFSGSVDAELSHGSPASFDGEKFNFDSKPGVVLNHDASGAVVVPDAHLLFSGDYKRMGNDLIISSSDQKFVVGNYFKGEGRPSLATKDGATLSGHIVDALTGHVMYAQAAAPAGSAVCGHVMKMTGSASVIRNGVSVELHIGDAIQKGDVVQTGSDSSIGMTLVDGSAFGMTSNARMVINEMIYDPNGSSNSSLISLVQGTITFVAGQTAKNGNMRVDTPVATMGIRGTAVLVEISANDGPTKFSVLVEPDGHTGSYNLYDKTTGQLLGTVSQSGQVTFVTSTGLGLPATATEQPKTLQDQQSEKALIQQVFQLYFPNYVPDDSKPNTTKTGHTDVGVPDSSLPKYAFDPTTGRPTLTVPTQVTNPETGKITVVNITFTNTPAIFQVTNAADVQASPSDALGPHSFRLGDHVTIIDPDIGIAVFYDRAVPYVTNTGVIVQTTGPASISSNTAYLLDPSLITLDRATGIVTYDPEAFRFLGEGETAVYKFIFTSSSGPDSASQQLVFTVTGHNDAPVFAVNDTPLALSETAGQTGQSTSDKITSIQLNFTDEDYSDVASSFTLSSSVTTKVTGTHSTTPDLSKLPDGDTLKSYLKIVADGVDTNLGVSRTVLSDSGQITAKFTAPDNVFDFLAEGEQIQLVYTIVVTDAHGASDTQTVTITVTGTNDEPVIAAGDRAQVTTIHEVDNQTGVPTADSSPGGSIHFSDVDLTDRPTTSISSQTATYTSADGQALTLTSDQLAAIKAGLTITAGANNNNGVVDWAYSIDDDKLDFLSKDEVITLVTTIEVTDGHGGVATATVTLNIQTGANDKPVVEAVHDVSLVEQPDSLHETIVAQFTDADLTETGHTASVEKVIVTGVVPPGTPSGELTSGALYGLLSPGTVTKLSGKSVGTAEFNFNAKPGVFDYLAAGEVVTLVYTIAVTDAAHASDTQTVTITVTGTNDAPTITSADLVGGVTEQCSPNGSLTDSGTIAFGDVDLSDTHHIDPIPSSGTLGTLTAEVCRDTVGGIGGEIAWKYKVDSHAVEYLAAGESKIETFIVTLDDGHGGTVSQTIEVTITGTNDAPVIDTIAATNLTEPANSSDAISSLPITVTFSDADLADTGYHATITGIAIAGDHDGLLLNDAALKDLITVDQATKASGSTAGEVDLHFSAPSSAFDYLAANESVTLTYTVSVNDGHTNGTGTQTFTVTITGTNDAPVLTADAEHPPQLTTITEDQTHNDGQTVASFLGHSISDADHNAQIGIAITGAESAHGHWEFSIDGGGCWDGFGNYDPSSALLLKDTDLIRFVPDGEHGGTDTFSYVAWDGTTGTHGETADSSMRGGDTAFSNASDTAELSVTSVNDGPTINFDNLQISTGHGPTTVTGLSISDPDSDHFTIGIDADHGTVSLEGGEYDAAAISAALQDGVDYRRGTDGSPSGSVTFTVSDGNATDTVNFVFRQTSSGPVTLLATEKNDVLIGGAGHDYFVFSSDSGHDVITNFDPVRDKIVLNGLASVPQGDHWFSEWAHDAIVPQGEDTLIHLDGTDTVLLKNVNAANLHANDFIIYTPV
ncbi:VCBS domain-containing protein [Bradyrhizobium sp. SYSU BS000235]|uniref:VCBS domain-containing protein n=1 Tax=Bradyrhizobium sp. SYSU BS000235 TaxID=3411332 RepID=UPI003C78FFA6